jgi:hypothetical protein
MRDLNTPLAPSTFGPGGGKKKKNGWGQMPHEEYIIFHMWTKEKEESC